MELPSELQNLVWEYADDALVQRRCGIGNPTVFHVIDWNHVALFEIDAMLYVRRFFPSYWTRSLSDADYRRIYESAKGYYVRMALRGINVRV